MKRRAILGLLLGAGAIALFAWLRPVPGDFANFPPTITGPWVAFGDSLTEGVGSTAGQDYPSLLGQRLGLEILNHGRSGETSEDGLRRLETVTSLHPRVVLLCFGGNDALRQVPRTQTMDNLRAMIARLQADGVFVVLIGIRSASLRDRNEEHFQRLAQEMRVFYVPDMLEGLAFKPVYMSDAIHPNDEGYARIVARLEDLLRPILPQLRAAATH